MQASLLIFSILEKTRHFEEFCDNMFRFLNTRKIEDVLSCYFYIMNKQQGIDEISCICNTSDT
jgi:hypothetical protein